MSKRSPIPWPESEYYLDEENKVIWLMGSFMRSMMLKDRRETAVPGYTIKLAQYDYIRGLKDAHSKEK